MALRLSTGLRNAILDRKAAAKNLIAASTISFEAGTGTEGRDRILDSGSGLGGYIRRDQLTVAGSGANDGEYEILAVAAGYVEIPSGSLSDEAAGSSIILAGAQGGSFTDIFRNCKIDVFAGTQPTSANDGETGTKLLSVTLNSGAFVAGSPENGINFGEVTDGVLHKEAGEVWSGLGIADGTAGWFRIYDNNYDQGISTTAVRMDGSIATSGSQFNMSSTTVVTGGTNTIDSVNLTLPAA